MIHIACCKHGLRDAFGRARPALARDLKLIYTAPPEQAAPDRFAEFSGRLGSSRS